MPIGPLLRNLNPCPCLTKDCSKKQTICSYRQISSTSFVKLAVLNCTLQTKTPSRDLHDNLGTGSGTDRSEAQREKVNPRRLASAVIGLSLLLRKSQDCDHVNCGSTLLQIIQKRWLFTTEANNVIMPALAGSLHSLGRWSHLEHSWCNWASKLHGNRQ